MEARILMAIHDALWVEAPMHEETEVERLVKKMMTPSWFGSSGVWDPVMISTRRPNFMVSLKTDHGIQKG